MKKGMKLREFSNLTKDNEKLSMLLTTFRSPRGPQAW
jgi:hypothetical protein